jgi:hypothetical protein
VDEQKSKYPMSVVVAVKLKMPGDKEVVEYCYYNGQIKGQEIIWILIEKDDKIFEIQYVIDLIKESVIKSHNPQWRMLKYDYNKEEYIIMACNSDSYIINLMTALKDVLDAKVCEYTTTPYQDQKKKYIFLISVVDKRYIKSYNSYVRNITENYPNNAIVFVDSDEKIDWNTNSRIQRNGKEILMFYRDQWHVNLLDLAERIRQNF